MLRPDLQDKLDDSLQSLLMLANRNPPYGDLSVAIWEILRECTATREQDIGPEGEMLLMSDWEEIWKSMNVVSDILFQTKDRWHKMTDPNSIALHDVFEALVQVVKDSDTEQLKRSHLEKMKEKLSYFLARRGRADGSPSPEKLKPSTASREGKDEFRICRTRSQVRQIRNSSVPSISHSQARAEF